MSPSSPFRLFFFSISLFNHALLSLLPPSGIVALHLCYLTPSYAALLMQLFNTKQPALFFSFYPVLSFLPCSLCLSLPCSYSYFALAQQIPVVIVITKNTPPPPRVGLFLLSLSLLLSSSSSFFFFSLWMFFDWMRGERVCLGRCAQLIIFCIYPKERRRIVRLFTLCFGRKLYGCID